MKRLLVAAFAALIVAPTVYAVQDLYKSTFSQVGDPLVNPDGGVQWGTEWQPIDLPDETYLEPGQAVYFGKSNRFDPHKHKKIWIEWESFPWIYADGTRTGFPPNTFDPRPWDYLSDPDFGPGPGHLNHYEGIIKPQPSWEWICFRNFGNERLPIRLLEFKTECVPEPASMLAMGAGLAFLAAKRRR